MSIASIMVALDTGEAATRRVRLAADLACRFEATLTGVAARKLPSPGPTADIGEAQAAYDAERAKLADELALARDLFQAGAGTDIRTGWRAGEAGAEAFLVRQGRGADLIVVGRGAPHAAHDAMMPDPGAVLMEMGRPVLVVPPEVDRLNAARIVIAWKDVPEARRAVSAALPFIGRADKVFVTAASEARFEGAEEVSDLLCRHGAHVTTNLLDAPAGEVADAILRFARREDADLIVMGGYGHSRLQEWLFGGVTRDILRSSSLCCLMSH
ncbi:universal stress protein [Methylobacterium sp. 092160098-2]|uniref:universal stress protein n=1 Tax=Methylobacterium sp. 092160098-2 TaxID=3025129 RepID=UPI001E0B8FC4|nr:universal stress protein [Methylobacterium sp. 092160098-2]MBY0253979.1 universal stress protein [Methylobacterium organophilum]MDE4914660.1 universal stress protein [Methylobacterium sp. 092160098-2]